MSTPDHHSEYLAIATGALTPEGRKRVDELLEELARAGGGREWVRRFALVREAEADKGTPASCRLPSPAIGSIRRSSTS